MLFMQGVNLVIFYSFSPFGILSHNMFSNAKIWHKAPDE